MIYAEIMRYWRTLAFNDVLYVCVSADQRQYSILGSSLCEPLGLPGVCIFILGLLQKPVTNFLPFRRYRSPR